MGSLFQIVFFPVRAWAQDSLCPRAWGCKGRGACRTTRRFHMRNCRTRRFWACAMLVPKVSILHGRSSRHRVFEALLADGRGSWGWPATARFRQLPKGILRNCRTKQAWYNILQYSRSIRAAFAQHLRSMRAAFAQHSGGIRAAEGNTT